MVTSYAGFSSKVYRISEHGGTDGGIDKCERIDDFISEGVVGKDKDGDV